MNLWVTGGAWELYQRQAAPGAPAPLRASSHLCATGILFVRTCGSRAGPGNSRPSRFWTCFGGLIPASFLAYFPQILFLFFRGRPCGIDSLPVSDQPFPTPAASTTVVSGGTALAASEAIHDGDWSLRMAGASCCGGMVQWLIEGTASWSSVEAKNQKESVMRTQLSRE